MLPEYAHVKIKKTGITGVIVDVPVLPTDKHYTVESDERGVLGGYGESDSYKLYDCLESDLEVIADG